MVGGPARVRGLAGVVRYFCVMSGSCLTVCEARLG
jgi:hypothetical protein